MTEQNQDAKLELERISLEERLAKWRQLRSPQDVERNSYFVFGYIANMGVASVAGVAVGLEEDISFIRDLLLSLEQKQLVKDVTSSFASQLSQQKEIAKEDIGARTYQVTTDYPPMERTYLQNAYYGARQEYTSVWSVFKMYFKDLFRRRSM